MPSWNSETVGMQHLLFLLLLSPLLGRHVTGASFCIPTPTQQASEKNQLQI